MLLFSLVLYISERKTVIVGVGDRWSNRDLRKLAIFISSTANIINKDIQSLIEIRRYVLDLDLNFNSFFFYSILFGEEIIEDLMLTHWQ